MARVTSRAGLIDYCLRKLGFPVVSINVDDDQVEDRIDDALQFFQDYHYDATQKTYISHRVSAQDIANRYIDMAQLSGTANTIVGSNVVVGLGTTNFASELVAGISQVQIGSETKTVSSIGNNNQMMMDSVYANSNDYAPITSIDEANSIIGVTKILSIGTSVSNVNMFDLRYQMRLNDLYDFTSTSYVNYVLTQQHIRTLDMLFTGENPIRYNRHQNRLYIDFKWGEDVQENEFLLIESWKILDPEGYTQVYDDIFLKRYATALIKRQWGANLSKFSGIKLPGDVVFNGQAIFETASAEIEKIEDEIQSRFEEPARFIIG